MFSMWASSLHSFKTNWSTISPESAASYAQTGRKNKISFIPAYREYQPKPQMSQVSNWRQHSTQWKLFPQGHSQETQGISPAAEFCTTFDQQMKGNWVLNRVISSCSLTKLMSTGTGDGFMASQSSALSTMWRLWSPCPIQLLSWQAHLHYILIWIFKFNCCFNNAAYNTSQVRAAVVQVIKLHHSLINLYDPTRVMVMGSIFLPWWAWHILFKISSEISQ